MIKAIVVLLLSLRSTLQICGKGCLKCNDRNECLFCDVSNSYYLSGTTCEISNVSNCLIINSNGNCLQCDFNYFLDSSMNKCVAVGDTKLIKNCLYYGTDQSCVQCAQNSFVSNGACLEVSQKVDKCSIYYDDGKCKSCASGYIFNIARDKCVLSPNEPNCAAYSYIDCKSCIEGFLVNKNSYFETYRASPSNIFRDIKMFITGGYNDWVPIPFCQKILDPNCVLADSYNVCNTCKTGYYLTVDRTCRAYSKPVIQNCVIYNSLTTCSACLKGYYLENPNSCSPIPDNKSIADCAAYNNTSTMIQCVQCVPNKILFNNNCSLFRTNSINISNCNTTTVDADTCATCNNGYVLTTDGRKCLSSIQNCKQYNLSYINSTYLTCKVCADTFYIDVTNGMQGCLPGAIEGCLVYYSSTNCASCDSSAYYLSNWKCRKHVSIPNCLNYSATQFNRCESCAAGYFPFQYVATCSQMPAVPNCAQYSEANTCIRCVPGYFIRSDACVSISETYPNCQNAESNSTSCKNCKKGFAMKNLDNPRVCAQNHNYILDQCDALGSNVSFKDMITSDNDSCVTCKENSFPFDLGNLFSCIRNDLLATKGLKNSLIVDGCLKYGIENGLEVCFQCPAFLLINSSGARSCVASCNATTHTVIEDNLNGSYNTCAPYSSPNYGYNKCAQAIRVSYSSSNLNCVKSGVFKVIVNFENSYLDNPVYWRDIDGSTVPRHEKAFLYFGLYTSLADSTIYRDKHNNENQSDKNCEVYWSDSAKNLYCARCKWGYTVKFVSSTSKTICVKMDDCNTSISYTGFSQQLNQVLSCHVCSVGKSILVTTKITSVNDNYKFTKPINNVPVVQCVSVTSEVYQVNSLKPLAVDNCLVYGWFEKVQNEDDEDDDESNSAYVRGCFACEPGFKLNSNYGTCVIINDCDRTQNYMANRCSACTQTNSAGAVEYKAFKNLKADTCLLVKSDNCLFADSVADVNGAYDCRVCKPGFWLNHDKICERITLPQCLDSSVGSNFYSFESINSMDKLAEYYIIKFLSKAVSVTGCNSCADGFTGIKLPSNEKQCVSSPYAQNNTYVSSNSMKYVSDCAKYNLNLNAGNSPVATCAVCKNGKILNDDGTKCVSPIPNCVIAQSFPKNRCKVCATTHVQILGNCVLKNIVRCAVYDESPAVSELICKTCSDGYVLGENKKGCYAGYVYACKSYDVDLPWICNSCLVGYRLLKIANSKTYCLKINEATNCQVLNENPTSGLQTGFFQCTSCASTNTTVYLSKSYDVNNQTLPQSICLSLNPVDKCVDYESQKAKVAANTFRCIACSVGYYIDETTNICVPRTYQPAQCVKLYPNKDKCQTCSNTTFKNENETDCIEFPKGILRCATYFNDTVCASCEPPAYLYGNECLLSTVINNCISYVANYTCVACATGYFFKNPTTCLEAVAKNCYTYSDVNSCKTCYPGSNQGLKTETNGVTNCVDKNLPFCDIGTDIYPFSCVRCMKEYYADRQGICNPVRVGIDKCLFYDSEATCLQCEKFYSLSADRTSCIQISDTPDFDVNCADNRWLSRPVCSRCNPGNVFVNGSCTSCSSNTYYEGCFSCDPFNQTICFACRPGYYQSSDGSCKSFITSSISANLFSTSSSSVLRKIFGFLISIWFVFWFQ